jgi:hypothetical protein
VQKTIFIVGIAKKIKVSHPDGLSSGWKGF